MRGFSPVVHFGSVFACTLLWCGLCLADEVKDPIAEDSQAPAKPTVVRAKPAPRVAARAPHPLADSDENTEVQDDVVIVRYPNRRVKIRKHVAMDPEGNFINHGEWTMWDPHGNVIATGKFDQGKRHGTWSRLQPQTARHFDSPVYSGFTKPFAWETSFDNDVLHGAWKLVDADGRPMRSWEFDQGRLHGKATVWFHNGNKRHEISYHQGIPDGEVLEWDANGKEISKTHFTAGRRDKKIAEKHPNGRIAVEGAMRGAKEAVRVTFNWWEGSVKADMVRTKEQDVRHGTWTHRFPSGGRKYEGRFEEDQPVGIHTWWHANGSKRMQGQFVDGKEHGNWTWWHTNGHKSQAGNYLAGKKVGEWITWNQAGQITGRQDHSARAKDPVKPSVRPELTVKRQQSAPRGTLKPVPRVTHRVRGPLSRQREQNMPAILKQWHSRNGSQLR